MPNKITYTITTADGKEHQVSKENVDKYGIQSYADAYKGATIRMRDAQKGDYDIPLQHFDNARKQGLHAFSLEHTPIQKQTTPKATLTPTAKPATSPSVHPRQSTPQVSNPLLSDSFGKGADFLKPKPVGYNLSEEHRAEVLGEQAKRSNNPTNPHGQRAVQLGNEAKAKRVEREQKRFGKPTVVKAFDDAVHGDKKAAKELGMPQVMQQKKDEIDYMQATGKELRNPVDAGLTYDENGDVVHSMFAPTVARDEYGNIVTNEAGEPLVGISSDEARAKAYGDSVQTGIEAQREKDKVDNLYKDAAESVNDAFDEDYKKKEAFRKEHPFLGAVSDALEGFSNRGNVLQYTPEGAKPGLAALGMLSKAAVAKNNADRYGDAGTLSRLYGGIMAGLTDVDTYDFGITDTFNAANLYRAAKNYEEGKASNKDKMILDAATIANSVQAEASDKLGGAFGAGQNLVGTLGFMAQMATNPASGVGKEAAASVAKTVAKRALQKFGKGAIAKAVTGLAKGATRVGMDAVEAGVVTGMYSPTKIVGDYLNRKTGDVQSDGKGGYIFQNKEYSDVKALAKAINGQYAENISEMWGEYLPGVGKVNAAIGRGARKIGLGKVVDAFEHMSSSNWAKTWKNFQEKTKWNGMAGEYFEEVANNLYNAVTNGDMTLDTDPHTGVFNPKINLDTFYSVALMSGIMSGVNTAGYARERYKAPHEQRKADAQARAVFGERWEEYKDAIDNADEKQIGSVMEKIGSDKSLSNSQKIAALQYQYRTAVVHGVNAQDTKNKLEGQFNAMDEAYSMGYNLQDEKELNNTAILYDEAKKQAAKATEWDEYTLDRMIGEDGGASTLAYMKRSDEFNDEQLQAFTDYANARAAYNGMIQRVKDDIDTKVHESNLEVDQRTNLDTGAIHPATMKVDNRQVYIVNGNVVMLPDGNGVDHEHSDDFVVLRDAETGELETAAPSAIFKVDAPINVQEEKEVAADNIRQTFAQQQADKIDGKLEFKQGDTYSIIDKEDGTQHSLAIIGDAIDEKTGQVNPEMVLVDIDGAQQPILLPKEQVQQQVDEARRAAVAATQVIEHAPTNSANNTYNINDEVTLSDENGNTVRGSITAPENEDGKFEVYTEQPIYGKKVNLFSAEELDSMNSMTKEPTEDSEDATIQQPQQQEDTEDSIEKEAPQQQTTALERIPTDESGQPLYEQTDPETAWDAIVEQTGGDTSMAQTVADDMVSDLEAGVKKAEKTKTKSGGSIAEKIAAEKERAAVIEQAKATLAHWRKIAAVNRMREAAIQAEEQRKADEVVRVRKEQEEKARAEQEEAERIKREALNGVPDFVEDKAPDARARGYRRVNGDKVDRQKPIDATIGKEVQVKFDDDNIPTGHVAIIEANQLQPSHKNGQRNPQHFIDEAQPKERKDDASVGAARKIAANIRPEEITSSVTAYTGAPTVNSRGEVIQGNNRSAALREMWDNHQEQGDKYKKYLMDNAESFGLRAEDIAAMDKPVLVNMLNVNDDEAISLGQFVASDTESGGTERIKPKNVVKKLGDKMKNFANILLRANDENISFAELVDSNGVDALKWLNANGIISPTQYKSAFDSKGNITAEAKNDIKGIMYQSIFEGGSTQLEDMFNTMPTKAQKAILATAYRDYDNPKSERMVEEIQNSILAYYALSHDAQFMAATNHKDARMAVEAWKRQYAIDDNTGESYLPAEKYSNFALLLATMYKGDNQSFIQGTFNKMYDLIQGTQEETLFEQPDNTPRSLVQAIKETLNIGYNGQQRSNVLAGDSSASQEGRTGSNGDATPRGRSENIDGAEANQGGTEGDTGRSGSGQSSGGSQEEVAAENSHLTKKEAADFIAQMELGADVAQEIPLTIENWDKEFGEDGIVSTPIGDVKMGENQFAKLMRAGRNGKLGMLKPTLEYPDAIVEENSKAKEGTHTERPSSFIFIKSFRKADGTRYYYFTSITVSVDGKEVVVSNQEKSRNRILRLLMEGSVIWRTPKDATTSSAEKQGLDYVHPDKAEGETKGSVITPQNTPSVGKDKQSSDTKQEIVDNSLEKPARDADLFAMAERVAEEDKAKRTRKKEEAKVETNPTEAQKEAGNYKKGHIKLDSFNVTIEQPKGSVRRGKDANGKEWETEMHNTYGYIRGTESVDGDHIDIFLSDKPTEGNVFVVDQVNKDGSFDEHKVMYGFSDMESARKAYLSNYEEGWQGLGNITEVSKEEFKKWIDSSKRKTKPFAEYTSVKTEGDVNVQHPIEDKGGKRLVSNERYEELKKRMRSKLGQLNLGVDPEMLAIGAEMAVYHIENGARAFGAYAKEMISDLGDAIRPYLKAFYNGARDLPEMAELSSEMTPYDEVSRFDVATIGNDGEQLTPSAIETAEQINNEATVEFNAKQEQNNTNELEDVDNDTYSITKQHNNKKDVDIWVVRGKERTDKDVYTQRKQVAKEHNGYYSSFRGVNGFVFNSAEEAHAFADAIFNTQSEENRAQNSEEIMRKDILNREDTENQEKNSDEDIASKEKITDRKDAEEPTEQSTNSRLLAQYNALKEKYPDTKILLRVGDFYETYQDDAKDLSKTLGIVLTKRNDGVNMVGFPYHTLDTYLPKLIRAGYRVAINDKDETANDTPTSNGLEGRFTSVEDIEGIFGKTFVNDETGAEIKVGHFTSPYKIAVKINGQVSIEEWRHLAKTLNKEEWQEKIVPDLHGFNIGDKVMYKGKEATLYDIDRSDNNRPILDTGLAPVMYDVAYWEELSPVTNSEEAIAAKEEKVSTEKEKPTKKNNSKNNSVSLNRESTVGDLFGDLFGNNDLDNKDNEDNQRTRRENRKSDDGVSQRESSERRTVDNRQLDRDIEERRSERQGNSRVQSRNAEERSSTERPSGRLSRLNVSNNHAERGVDYAPTTVDARIEANIKAIELANELVESGEKATPEQMSVLRKFSGWGGLGKAFNQASYSWSKDSIPARLQTLLGAEGYEQAVMSANSAYYTPAYVIDTLWDIAKQMGFKGGNILEGSAGIGNILGLMPMDISDSSRIQAVEIDGTSGNILSLLYPEANVNIQGFEQTRVPNGSVDLAITNVPFVTGLRVNDTTGDGDLSKKFHNIHDFCIAKNVRKLREGGIGIFISSNGTLDSSQKLRDWLVSDGNADVVGAFRLNNKTFGGTGVTSDIIVIRKRVNGQVSPNAIDVSTVTGERSVEFDTGETKRVKGVEVPVVKHLSMDYNKYFIEHPEMMAGKMEFAFEHGDKYRATSKGLYPTNDKAQDKLLADFVQSFTNMKDEAASTKQDAEPINVYEELGNDVKEGSMLVNKDGQLCVAQLGQAVPLNLNANKVKGHTKEECFKAYTDIKLALNDVLKYQTENESNEGLQPLLDKLNKAYDSFVDTYGHLNKNTSIAFLRNDVDYPNVFSLEKYEEKADKNGKRIESFHKTDIFKKRVVEKSVEPQPKNVKDGIVVSVYKFGKIDISYISNQLGKTEEDVKREIIASGLGFENPVSKQVEVSYQYLSGNVREKLKQAEENNEDGEYNTNIKALKEVVPNSIPAHLIEFNLGSSWIAPELYEEYVKDKTDVDVKFTAAGGTWFMKEPHWTDNEKNRSFGVHSDLLGKHVMGHELIEAAIQNKTITVSTTRKHYDGTSETITDKEATQACSSRIDEIRQEFKDWARNKMQSNPEMSDKIEQVYNDLFNNYVPIDIPSEYIPEHFGGATHNITLRPHQAKAVVRGTMQPLMLAHEVGTGKTFTLISTAMEMRRLGTARKPMIVVQNATVGQFVASAKQLYPNAKILTLEDGDRSAKGRKNFYAKIRYNDWDMIVVPQSTFEFIPDSEERQMTFIQDKIEEKLIVLAKMKDADKSGRNLITRQAEKEVEQLKEELADLTTTLSEKRTAKEEKKRAVTKQNTEVKAREMLERRTDETENFDDMGIDALLIDEAHEYKHLGFATAMQRGVNGVDPSYSKKSQGVFLKTQAVLQKSHGRNVIFATGTPISNTAAEIWTFMRYLMPSETMKEYGIYYFDDFVRNFGNIQQMLEFTTSGKFRENNRFAGYIDLPELVRIWSSVSDTVRTKDAGGVSDKIPEMEGDKAQDLYLPQTTALRGIMKYVKAELEAYDKMSGKEKKENSHIPLTMYSIAKAAAVDARLVDETAEDDPNSKTNEAVRQTLRSLKETASYNGTVALFADNYQNKMSGFNLYEDVKDKLIAAGIPEKQIVVMKSGMTVKKKLEIFDKVNRGEVRVIMGSTFTLGTGVNIQERLHTLIHIDAPNRPMDYTQRNGRILRQGNIHKDMNKPVRVLRFGVEDSLDVTAYQRLKTKGAIAESIMNGKQLMANSMENRILEEEEDAFGDTVAQLSGSEYAMLKNQAEKNVRKYESRKRQWEADQTYIHNAKPRFNGLIKNAQLQKEENEKNLSLVNNTYPDGKFKAIIIGKHKYDSVAGIEDFFKDHNKKVKEESEKVKNGTNATYGSTINVDIDGLTFAIHTEVSKEMSSRGINLFAKSTRTMTYSQKELGLEDVPVKGALMRNAIEDITDNIITGNDFKERVERAKQNIAHYSSDLEHILSREGKPFEFESELEEAKAKFVEYTEAMKKEMEEKEKKYAEMDKNIDANSNLSNIEYEDGNFSELTAEEPHFNVSSSIRSLIEGNLFSEVDFSDSPNKNVNQAISKLTDDELLKEIAKGDSKEWNFYMEEYDRRHNKEFQEAVERYMNSLEDEKTSLDTAYGSYVNVAKNWSNGGYHTTERTLLRAQLDAIEDYVSKKESEQLSSVESEAYHQAKETVRKVGYDLTRLRLRPLEEGEACHVERRYTESNGFSFTGKEHIESIEDIAYIFKQLETSSVENSFLVLIKDGTPTVLHLSIGSYATALAPIEQAIVAADAINPDKVLFVHNHPSGNISASKQDMDVQKKMKEIFGGKVMPAIIINTTSGKFGMFSEDGRLEDGNIPLPDEHNNIPINVYQFSQQVFAKDWNPEFAFRAVSPESIAEYVSSHRLGEHKKMSLIILDQAGHVTGNVFLPWTKLTDVDSHKNIMQIISYVNQMGGRSAILYGNYELGEDTRDTNKSIFKIKTAFSNSALHLMDVINIDDSALGRGAMEEDVEYGKRNLNEEKYREGYGSYTNSELSFINDPVAKMLGKSNRTEEDHKAFAERERQRMISRISELADRLHLDNIETVTDSNGLQGKKAKAKGFYSKSSGKITIVIPNHASVEDVEKTLLHEAVAHYGLRKLFGEHFETFLDNVYQNVEPEIRRIITSQAANNNWDFRTATEEYLAGLAERTDFERVHYAIWNKIKSLFLKMLHSIGFEGWSATELSDNELRYLLWRSYENLKEPGRYRSILGEAEDVAKQNELKVGNYDQQDTNSSNVAEREILYREDDSKEKERVNAREKYEQRVNRAMFQTQEALQDSMLGLKEAMNAITKAEGKNVNIEDIDGYENAYLGENRLSSVNKAEADAFAHLLFKPMLAEVTKLCKNAQERAELVDYMMAKHGLERNAVMRKRAIDDILNNEKLSDAQKSARAGLAEYRDYAGLTALTGKDNVTEAEADAEVMVSEYENTHDTTNLWDKINAVNAAILSKSYECGMMDKDTYEKISDMYKYYIPLRGFDETTSEEAYAYLLHQNSAFNAPIKVAKGRSSKADDPFANMQSMAESAITQGNRNKLVKQRFFNFVLNHPSDLVSISDMWLKYDDVADEWKPVFPDNFEENDSAEDIEQKLKEFEDKMKTLAEQAPDKYKHGKETANIPYRVVDSRDLRQHQVLVKRGGRDYVLTLNGNPRAAQALNGQTNPDNDTSGAIGAILKAGEMVNRQLSAFYTTRNPDFVVSNFIRDMLYSNSIVWVKESPNYALRFHRNIARCNPAQIKVLLAKHRKGTLDMNNKLEHMFYQFMMNGGETGYANVRDIEQHKNDIRRELKRANGKLSITKAFNLLGEKLDEYNRAVENCARFAAYLTSREMGRTVERSIYDAKEISVNFNKKGSGAKFMNAVGQTKIGTASAFVSGIGRSGFVFWNAAIQGTTNFGRQFKKHPAKAFTASAIMFLLGAVIAGIGMGDGDDDADANSYWNLPEYVRRSNILFKAGDQWVSIPLPVEYRATYGMGELMVSAMSGKEHFTGSELGKAIAGQATQVLPIDFLEGGGGVKAFVPSAVKPLAEVYSNKGWTGMPIYKDTPYNKYMPEWTKAYKSANKYLVGIAKTLNETTGGDAYTKGSVDINPAQIEYLLNGYFGGVSGTIDKLSKSAETIAGDREYDPRNFLLLNRILKNGDERTEARAINNEYIRVKEEHDVLKERMKHYENDTDKGLFDYADKIDFLYNSPEFARYEIFEDYSKDIDALYKELKEANDGAEHLSIEKELTELKKEMIEEMNKTRK